MNGIINDNHYFYEVNMSDQFSFPMRFVGMCIENNTIKFIVPKRDEFIPYQCVIIKKVRMHDVPQLT